MCCPLLLYACICSSKSTHVNTTIMWKVPFFQQQSCGRSSLNSSSGSVTERRQFDDRPAVVFRVRVAVRAPVQLNNVWSGIRCTSTIGGRGPMPSPQCIAPNSLSLSPPADYCCTPLEMWPSFYHF